MNGRVARTSWVAVAVIAGVAAGPGEAVAQVANGLQPQIPSTWTKHTPSGPVIGADGLSHTATCSGFPGTDPQFSFWAKKGTTNNLVIFFEGGGACWDNLTCSQPSFVPAISPSVNPAGYFGLFDLANPANPIRDWSFVYIPYCTGDVHLGSASRQYFNAVNQNFPPGTPFTLRHAGFDNFMVVLDWIRNTFRQPQKILVTGSSAGAYGAVGNSPWILEAYPTAHTYVIGDAGQGVNTPAFDAGSPGRNSWNPQLAPWVFGTDPSLIPGIELMRTVADAYPRSKFSQFTTNLDGVQIGFYAVMKQFYGPGGSCPNPAVDWNNQMLEGLIDTAEAGNFRGYLAGGTYHTIMRSPTFYTENSPGITFSAWVAAMLKNQGGTNGTGGGLWANLACPTCTTPLPCP